VSVAVVGLTNLLMAEKEKKIGIKKMKFGMKSRGKSWLVMPQLKAKCQTLRFRFLGTEV